MWNGLEDWQQPSKTNLVKVHSFLVSKQIFSNAQRFQHPTFRQVFNCELKRVAKVKAMQILEACKNAMCVLQSCIIFQILGSKACYQTLQGAASLCQHIDVWQPSGPPFLHDRLCSWQVPTDFAWRCVGENAMAKATGTRPVAFSIKFDHVALATGLVLLTKL